MMGLRAYLLIGYAVVALGCGEDSQVMVSDAGSRDSASSGPMADSASPTPDSGVEDASMPMPSDAAINADVNLPTDSDTSSRGEHSSFRPEGFDPSGATRLVIMGDSIAAGFGLMWRRQVAGYLLAENDDERWPAASDVDLESFLGMAPEVVDVSANGATTRSVSTTQLSRLDSMLATPVAGKTLVMVIAGGNDLQAAIVGGNPTGQVLTNALNHLRTTAEFFSNAERFPDGAQVMMMDVYDPSDGEAQIPGCFLGLRLPSFVAALDVWRDRYTELGAELGFAVADALGHFHGHAHHHDNTSNPYYDPADSSMWFYDCIHPNERGHHEIRRLFYQLVDPSHPL